MEFSQCVHKESLARLADFYKNMSAHGAEVKGKASGGYVSGGTAATGGLAALNEYADSVYSSAKEGLIRKIAKDMNDILGIKGNKRLNADGDISEIVKQMNDILPNPRKRRGIRSNKDGATKYTAVHKDLCKALAESINKNYGSGIIDLGQSDNALCNSVSEVIHSLITGMHSEFSTIAADVGQVIRNLTVMMEFLKRSHEKLKSVVLASNDPSITSQAGVIDKFYEKLVKETNRQLAVLNNLMGGVVSPVGNDFLQVLRETEDFKGFVEDIKGTLGSEEFGNKLGYLLAGVNNVAQTAKMVDKALKEIGMSVKDYKKTSGIENLRDEIYTIMSRADKMTSDGLIKFMKAADVLYRNDMQHPEIVEYLESQKVSGGTCPACGSVSGGTGCGCGASGGYNGGNVGGADLEFKDMFSVKEGLSTNKFGQRDKARELIFKDFEKQLLSMYQRIVGCVQQIGPKIGSEIAVSDELMKFVRSFNQIEGANRNSIASALSGYNKSGLAKDVRNNFLSSLEVLDITLDPLVSKHNLFRELRQEINLLIKLVDQFSSKFIDAVTSIPVFGNKTLGGEIGGVIVNSEPPAGMTERYASFGRAQFQLYYFSRIASIKRSMARASTEKKSTGEDYTRIVGQATARLINEQATEYKKHLDSLSYWDKDQGSWTDEKDFDEKLPKGSPGRALYFYVNTVSGFEPTKGTGVNECKAYFRGNILGKGTVTDGRPPLANDIVNATNVDWTGFTMGGAIPPSFQVAWNFNDTQAPANVINGLVAGAAAPDAARSHTPALLWLDQQQVRGAGEITSRLMGLLGITDINELTQDKNGAPVAAGGLPKAFDKTYPKSLLGKRFAAARKLVESIKLLETRAFNAKKDLIEVAENIDLYLSSFTDSMLAKPESLLSLAKIMQRVAVVRKMYTEASGDVLAQTFEMFPVNILNGNDTGAAAAVGGAGGDEARYTGGLTRLPGQHLETNVLPGTAIEYQNENYYSYVGKISEADSSVGNHRLALDLSNITGEGSKENNIDKLMKNIEKSVLGVRTLENILLAFVQIGNEQTSQTFLTHGKVLKSLFNYVTLSAITRHYSNERIINAPVNFAEHTATPPVNNTVFATAGEIEERVASFDLYGPLKMALTITVNQISAYGANASYKDDFKTTDQLMEMIMKAICAKVLTVLGLYQIYNKPTENYLSFSAIRSIIGGGSVERPKVIPEAVDLYVRLPLLAEWFRNMLVGPSTSSPTTRSFISSDNYMLAMVPDVTNLWGEFLKTIFVKNDLVEEGNYSDDDTATLITEINKIYNSYKSKNNNDTVLSACEGLVTEINTRYSIVKKTDIDKYWSELRGNRFKEEIYQTQDEDFVDFDLLDSRNGAKVKAAPSDRFMDVNLITAAREGSWSNETFDVIKSLHAKMFKTFNEDYKDSFESLGKPEEFINEGKFSIMKYSFDGIIRQYKDELKVASTEEERYKIACKSIQDVGKMSDVNPDKVVILHEFVIAPLTSLMSTYNTVRNIIESFIWMSKGSLDKVLAYLEGIRIYNFNTIGVAHVNASLQTGGGGLVNPNHYNAILDMALEYFNPAAAPFLRELFLRFEEFGEHGYDTLNTPVFGLNAADPNTTVDSEKSRLLSTKRLFKTHMQILSNIKASLGNKFTLEFTNKSYPIVNFNSLVNECEAVLNNVKKTLVYLRPSLPLHIIKRYEDSTNIGSIYWLEENLFSDLFYNEKNYTKYEEIKSPAIPAGAGNMPEYFDASNYVLHPTLPLLNNILKDSFGLVVKRANKNELNGRSICERGMMELCAWGFNGNNAHLDINSDSARHFPFNVVDMIDDIDPAIGKVRKLLFDKKLQTAVAELTKKMQSLDNNTVNISTRDKIYRMLRPLVASGAGNVPKGIPNRVNAAMNNARNLDEGMAYDVLTDVRYWLDNIVVPRFLTSVNANDKIGNPTFGLPVRPFEWDGLVGAADLLSVPGCLGLATYNAHNNDTHPSFTTSQTFAAYKAVLEDQLSDVFASRAANQAKALHELGTAAGAAGVAAARRAPSSNVFPVQPSNAGNIPNVTAKLDTWLNGQMDELNNCFEPYYNAFNFINDADVVAMLNDLGMPVMPAPAPAPARALDIRTRIVEIGTALSHLRFLLGYRHLAQVTTYGAAAGAASLGIGDPVTDAAYIVNQPFRQAVTATVQSCIVKLYNNTNNNITRDSVLDATLVTRIAQHSTVIANLAPAPILANSALNGPAWIIPPMPIAALTREATGESTFYKYLNNLALQAHAHQAAAVGALPEHATGNAIGDMILRSTIGGAIVAPGAANGASWDLYVAANPATLKSAVCSLAYLGILASSVVAVGTAVNAALVTLVGPAPAAGAGAGAGANNFAVAHHLSDMHVFVRTCFLRPFGANGEPMTAAAAMAVNNPLVAAAAIANDVVNSGAFTQGILNAYITNPIRTFGTPNIANILADIQDGAAIAAVGALNAGGGGGDYDAVLGALVSMTTVREVFLRSLLVALEDGLTVLLGGKNFTTGIGAGAATTTVANAVTRVNLFPPLNTNAVINTQIASLSEQYSSYMSNRSHVLTANLASAYGLMSLEHNQIIMAATAIRNNGYRGAAGGTDVNTLVAAPYAPGIGNTEVMIAVLSDVYRNYSIYGYEWILSVTNVTKTDLNPNAAQPVNNAGNYGIIIPAQLETDITNITRVQNSQIDANLAIAPVDQGKAESWLRKLVIKYTGSQETNFWKTELNQIMREIYGLDTSGRGATVPNLSGMYAAFIANRINIYDKWTDKGIMSTEKEAGDQSVFNSRGLLVQFNQLLAAYIGSFVEPGSKKFYAPLVEGIVNSKLSEAITSGNAIADINIINMNGVGIPKEGSVLCASLARAIRVLLYKKQENSKELMFATNSLLEVASFMRESMKANLPHFAKLFNQLADTASTYKKFVLDNHAKLKLERTATNAAVAAGQPYGTIQFDGNAQIRTAEAAFGRSQSEYIDPNLALSESECNRYYRVLLDNVEMGCMSVVKCISHVYKELNDVPLFGETYSGSLIDFKQKSGKYPLALPSLTQAFLHHNAYNKGVGLPAAHHGSDAFKLLFMTRRVLTENSPNKASGGNAYGGNAYGGSGSVLDFMPGFIEVINNYNSVSAEPSKIPKALIESSIKNNMDLVNLLIDLKVRGSWVMGYNSAGSNLFRREIYGSATRLDVDKNSGGGGFNGVGPVVQAGLRTDANFVNYAKLLGLSPTDSNQSIYILKASDKKFKIGNVDVTRTGFYMRKFNDTDATAVRIYNTVEDWPAVPGGLGLRPAPAGGEVRYVSAYSDTLKHPTSLVSYPFASANNLSELITLTESTDLQYNKRRILDLFTNLSVEYDLRKKSRFYNILDLNISPINIHALQSKVPLINLLNYSFTFDKFVVEKLNIASVASDSEIFPENTSINDTKTAFARMLIHPYKIVDPEQFNTWHSRVAVGATGSDIPMDRPKYFSDQIYNKVCLQSLNPSDFSNPGGPGYVMERERMENFDAVAAGLATTRLFINNQVLRDGAIATGNGVPDFNERHAKLLKQTVAKLANGAAVGGAATSVAALQGAAAAGAALDQAFIGAWLTATKTHIDTRKAAVDADIGALVNPRASTKAEAKRFNKLICDAVLRAADGFARFATSQINVNPNGAVVPSPDDKIRYTAAGVVNQNDIFLLPNWIRTINIYVAEALVADMGRGNAALVQPVDSLYYIDEKEEVKRVNLPNKGNLIVAQGKLRYDTKLVRNLSWFSHLHRFLLWSIKDSLVKSSQPVVSDQGVIDPTLIDFRGYQSHKRSEYHL